MGRRYELEIMRRSLAMRALRREVAINLVEELATVQERLERLRSCLLQLIDDEPVR